MNSHTPIHFQRRQRFIPPRRLSQLRSRRKEQPPAVTSVELTDLQEQVQKLKAALSQQSSEPLTKLEKNNAALSKQLVELQGALERQQEEYKQDKKSRQPSKLAKRLNLVAIAAACLTPFSFWIDENYIQNAQDKALLSKTHPDIIKTACVARLDDINPELRKLYLNGESLDADGEILITMPEEQDPNTKIFGCREPAKRVKHRIATVEPFQVSEEELNAARPRGNIFRLFTSTASSAKHWLLPLTSVAATVGASAARKRKQISS